MNPKPDNATPADYLRALEKTGRLIMMEMGPDLKMNKVKLSEPPAERYCCRLEYGMYQTDLIHLKATTRAAAIEEAEKTLLESEYAAAGVVDVYVDDGKPIGGRKCFHSIWTPVTTMSRRTFKGIKEAKCSTET